MQIYYLYSFTIMLYKPVCMVCVFKVYANILYRLVCMVYIFEVIEYVCSTHSLSCVSHNILLSMLPNTFEFHCSNILLIDRLSIYYHIVYVICLYYITYKIYIYYILYIHILSFGSEMLGGLPTADRVNQLKPQSLVFSV